MNYKTNFYGAVGLASTLGKHSFALGQNASRFSAGACYYTRQVVEIKTLGYNVFESLENTSRWSEAKCKSASTKCQALETWAQQKWEQAKKQAELNEDWKDNVNPEVPTLKKVVGEKLLSAKAKTVKGIRTLEEKFFPQNKVETPKKAAYSPSYFERVLGTYLS